MSNNRKRPDVGSRLQPSTNGRRRHAAPQETTDDDCASDDAESLDGCDDGPPIDEDGGYDEDFAAGQHNHRETVDATEQDVLSGGPGIMVWDWAIALTKTPSEALMLSDIFYWTVCRDRDTPRSKHRCQGHYWLLRTADQWGARLRLKASGVRKIYRRLVEAGLLIRSQGIGRCSGILHVRPNFPNLKNRISQWAAQQASARH